MDLGGEIETTWQLNEGKRGVTIDIQVPGWAKG